MRYEISHPLYVFSENEDYVSRVIGFATDAAGRIEEVLTEFGSVPPSADLEGVLRSLAVEVAR